MNISFKYTIILLIILNSIHSPIQAIFESLILIKWKPNEDGKEIELFIIGDVHISNQNPQSENAQRDAKDTQLLQLALDNWNVIRKVAYLGESNAWVAKQNREVRKRNPTLYDGVYYTIPEYIENNNKQLSNIAFNMCDMRGPAFFETKKAIFILQGIFNGINTFLNTPGVSFDTDVIEQNIDLQLKQSTIVSTQKFLDELKNFVKDILEFKLLDQITYEEIKNYAESLETEIEKFELLFNQNLNNDLTKSTFEGIAEYLKNKFHFNTRDQSKPQNASLLVNQCLNELKIFNEEYEKSTNMVADVGFILALQKQKETHNKIVMFLSNNHAIAIYEYLKKQYPDKTNICFAQGNFEYQYTSHKKNSLSHEQAHNFFCIPFNKNILLKEISSVIPAETKKYLCNNCPNINIVTQFQRCARCKNSYYCSTNCQKKHWLLHQPNCKIALPNIQKEKEEINNIEIKLLPEQIIKNIPEQINTSSRNESTLEKMGGPIILGSLLALKCLLHKK